MTRSAFAATRPAGTLPPAVLLMGPTASGKSALALALCERFALEIVSVDSAQVYRGMDIGTAKPDAATRARCPHHLVDLIEPTDSYSAARFRTDALTAMRQIVERGRVPLLVGGTMLYFSALRQGLSDLPPADEATRRRLETQAREAGWPALHRELARVDAATASRLDPNDAQRIQRALEVFLLAGEPMSALLQRSTGARPPFELIEVALIPSERGELHRRIAERFDAMLKAGLVEELASLRRKYPLRAGMPSMRCVGYRQAWQYLDGEIDRAALRESGIAATRQLAKRQLTWLRTTQAEIRLDCLAPALPRDLGERLAPRLAQRA